MSISSLRWRAASVFITAGAADFGWEICSTGGSPERFRVSAYKLTGVAR